jgi:hypothetical protein
MTVIIQLIATALLGGFFGAYFTHLYTRRVENQKVSRTRQAVGTVIQAELAHFHLELSDHHRIFGRISSASDRNHRRHHES